MKRCSLRKEHFDICVVVTRIDETSRCNLAYNVYRFNNVFKAIRNFIKVYRKTRFDKPVTFVELAFRSKRIDHVGFAKRKPRKKNMVSNGEE